MEGAKFNLTLKSDTGRGTYKIGEAGNWNPITYTTTFEINPNSSAKIIICRDSNTTIDFELTETTAPNGYVKAEGTAKVSFANSWINYEILPRNYNYINCNFDDKNVTYTLDVINEKVENPKLNIIVKKVDENGNGISGMKYQHAIFSSNTYEYNGTTYTVSKDGNSDYKFNYFNWGETHPMETDTINFSTIEFKENVQFYFSETEAPVGYKTLDSGIFFSLVPNKNKSEKEILVKKCKARAGSSNMTRNSLKPIEDIENNHEYEWEKTYDQTTNTYTVTITIKNEELPKLKLKKIDSYTGLPVSGVKFKINSNNYSVESGQVKWGDCIYKIQTLEGDSATSESLSDGRKQWEIETGKSGIIYIILQNLVNVTSKDIDQLRIEEIQTQNRYNNLEKNTFYLGYNYNNEKKWFTNNMWYEPDSLEYINSHWVLDNEKSELTIKNDYQGFGLDLDITKVNEDGNGIEGAIFDYKITSSDNIPFQYKDPEVFSNTECTYCHNSDHLEHTQITTGSIDAYDGQCPNLNAINAINALKSNQNGKIDLEHITMYPKDGEHFGTFWILLQEKSAQEGYKKLEDRIFLKFSHVKTDNNNTYRWKLEARLGDGSFLDSVFIGEEKDICLTGKNGEQVTIKNFRFTYEPDNTTIKGIKAEVTIENKWKNSPKDIVISKIDANDSSKNLPGAEFKITNINNEDIIKGGKIQGKYFTAKTKTLLGITDNDAYVSLERLKGLYKENEITLITTDEDTQNYGKIIIENVLVSIKNADEKNIIELQETKAPDGYFIPENSQTIIRAKLKDENIKLFYSKTIGKSSFGYYVFDDDISYDDLGILMVPIKNQEIHLTLALQKKDAITGLKMDGVKFKIDKSNIVSGQIEIENRWTDITSLKDPLIVEASNGSLIMKNVKFNGNNILRIEEYSTLDGYIKAEGTITITWDSTQNKWVSVYGNSTNKIYGNHDCTAAGGYDSTTKVLGIIMGNYPSVNLGGKVWIDEQSGTKPTIGPDGIYNNDGEGTYDILQKGVNVSICNEDGNILDTMQTDDNGYYGFKLKKGDTIPYNIKFEYDGINYEAMLKGESVATEINRNTFNKKFNTITQGKANNTIDLTYFETATTSTVKTLNQNYNVANNLRNYLVKDNFKMYANTENYNDASTDRTNVNCALQRRVLDLALESKVDTATTTINGKTSTYTYNGNSIKVDGTATFDSIGYGLELYTSDYNYRKKDYKTTDKPLNKVNPQDITEENLDDIVGNELEVYVTYKIALKNQRSTTAKINEVMVYYNNTYIIKKVTINGIDVTYKDDQASEIDSYQKVTLCPNAVLGAGVTENISITFQINKKNDKVILGEKNLIAEITSYSTDTGMIDIDSAPGNAINDNGSVRREDDTDMAEQLTVSNTGTRTIFGNVWEDTNKDGNTTPGENNIQNVIVQLIEIKQINKINFEYIWQEKQTDSDGNYTFTGFIPADYIVRFIYGDGSTYNYYDNARKYNGYEYKSTIKTEKTNNSAVDNEARRLEVMAQTVNVDNENLGENLRNKVDTILDNTWMCAETDKFETSALQMYIAEERRTGTRAINATPLNIERNFGLQKRPETKITLEKHLKNLKITASNGKVLLDTANDIKKILTQEEIGTRTERGTWRIEAEVEILQGATLEAEYEYTVKNESEEDYTTEFLLAAFENTEEYINTLKTKAFEVKTEFKNAQSEYAEGTYLGQYYYNGNSEGCVPVTIKVSSVQEALNNNLVFKEGDFDVTDGTEKNGVIIQENTGATAEDEIAKLRDKLIKKDETNNNIKLENLNKIITTNSDSGLLVKDATKNYTAKLTRLLSPSTTGDDLLYDSYLAQIMGYSTLTGTPDAYSIPENLLYNHSKTTDINLESGLNEPDEAWAERITISNPTGEDKNTMLVYTLITISALIVVAGGAVLIKKYIIK